MVRSLLARGKIPKSFWPEAVNWSIHVLNRCPTFSVQNMTPEDAWSGRKPAVDHFRIFGCIPYAHVPNVKRKKLDDKGEKCVFFGVNEVSKAYKLFNPFTKKIVTSRDVIFDEESTWNWSGQQPTSVIFYVETKEENENSLQQQIPVASSLENSPNEDPAVDVTSPIAAQLEEHEDKRAMKRPGWMQDYEVTGINTQYEDPLIYFALFSYCDPVIFEDAVKESKWRKAMDVKIAAIEKNNT